MKGVINLRGAVLPIIDLSARLGMKPAVPTVRHVIIVTQVKNKVVGLLVDAVSDILTIGRTTISSQRRICVRVRADSLPAASWRSKGG
jgi:purine-binding chemotaxis protein CheW